MGHHVLLMQSSRGQAGCGCTGAGWDAGGIAGDGEQGGAICQSMDGTGECGHVGLPGFPALLGVFPEYAGAVIPRREIFPFRYGLFFVPE